MSSQNNLVFFTLKPSGKIFSYYLYVHGKHMVIQSDKPEALEENAKLLKMDNIVLAVDLDDPVLVKIPGAIIAPISVPIFDISKLQVYVEKLAELRDMFVKQGKTLSKTAPVTIIDEGGKTRELDQSLITYFQYIGMKQYITNMFVGDRYTARDISDYNMKWDQEHIFELGEFVQYFYLHHGKAPSLDYIYEKYSKIPLYFLQMLYRKYVDSNYVLIRNADAYAEYFTVIV